MRDICLVVACLFGMAGCSSFPKSGIEFYQEHVSPLKGYHCQFSPSCSDFALQAIDEQGVMKGLLMYGDRSIRCHPCAGADKKYKFREVGDAWRLSDPVKNNLLQNETVEKGKSPVVGGLLSAFIPSAGYFYSGRYTDGASALLKMTFWGGLSAICSNNRLDGPAYGFGTIGTFYYASNIYGGANATCRYNRLEKARDDQMSAKHDSVTTLRLFELRW